MVIDIVLIGKQGLVYKSEDVMLLRKEGRIVGNMIGHIKGKKNACDEGTLPLLLSPEEVTIALLLGLVKCYVHNQDIGLGFDKNILFSLNSITIPLSTMHGSLQEATWTYPQTPQEHLRFAIFKDLHSKNFFMTNGIKFGGDWLAYPGDPLLFHAQFVVKVYDMDEILNPLIFVAFAREAHAARKHLLLCYSTQDSSEKQYTDIKVEYLTVAPYDGFRQETKRIKQNASSS